MSRLSYCILNESDLEGPDEAVRDKIQEARLEWLREAFSVNDYAGFHLSGTLSWTQTPRTRKGL
jgi:hypothetical protein